MEENHRNALRRTRLLICQDMDAMAAMPHLLTSCEGIQERHSDEIKSIVVKEEQNARLLSIVLSSGPTAFQAFVGALHKTGKQHIAGKIIAELSNENVQQNDGRLDNESEMVHEVGKSLKEYYSTAFKLVNPLSMNFTFDIEKTFVSLTFKSETMPTYAETENHAEMLSTAFTKYQQLLIIEGAPAMGKTTLMKRFAYEWGHDDKFLSKYSLVLYAEFRHLHGRRFETVLDMAIEYFNAASAFNDNENLFRLIKRNAGKMREILILLDGYDEADAKDQCAELNKFFDTSLDARSLPYNVVISTRPGYLSHLNGHIGFCHFAHVHGFSTQRQKLLFIKAFFRNDTAADKAKARVENMLQSNSALDKLAETPLFLTFICLVYETMKSATEFDLYCRIIWWMLDRYQRKNSKCDVPALFEYQAHHCNMVEQTVNLYLLVIQGHCLEFPLLHKLSKMAFECYETLTFDDSHIKKYNINDAVFKIGLMVVDERRNSENHRLQRFYSFPHKTLQEFLAGGIYYFPSLSIKADNFILVSKISNNNFSNSILKLEDFVWQATTIDKDKLAAFFLNYRSKYMSVSEIGLFSQSGFWSQSYRNNYNNRATLELLNLHTLEIRFDKVDLALNINLNNFPKLQTLIIRGQFFNENEQPHVINFGENCNKRSLNIKMQSCNFKSVATLRNVFDHLLRMFHPTTSNRITIAFIDVKVLTEEFRKVSMFMDCREIQSMNLAGSSGDPFVDLIELVKNMNELEIWDCTDAGLRNLHLSSGICFAHLTKLTLYDSIAHQDSLAVFLSSCPNLKEFCLYCKPMHSSQPIKFESMLANYPRALENTSINRLKIAGLEYFSSENLMKLLDGIEKCSWITLIHLEIFYYLRYFPEPNILKHWYLPEGSIVEQLMTNLASNVPQLEELRIELWSNVTSQGRDSWNITASRTNETGKKRNRNFQCILWGKHRKQWKENCI